MILAFTPVGFPYSDNKSDPRLQRFRVLHSKRTFYDVEGNVTFNDSGFLLSTIDRNSLRTLESSFPSENLIEWTEDEKCDEVVRCGFPIYRFSRGKYMKAKSDGPTVEPTPFVVLSASRNPVDASLVIVDFTLQLKTLTQLYITPGEGWTYKARRDEPTLLQWRGKTHKYSKITYGKKTDELMRDVITFEVRFIVS